jgi:hypothetical protein
VPLGGETVPSRTFPGYEGTVRAPSGTDLGLTVPRRWAEFGCSGRGSYRRRAPPSAPLGVSAAAETQARDGADGAKARPTQPVSRPGR